MANTAAAYSEVMIASAAASLLDDYRLSSLDDDTPLARFMAREFGLVRDELLRMYPWSFARHRVALTPLSTAPIGWAYGYALPADHIRSGTQTRAGSRDGISVPHEIEGHTLYSNFGPTFYFRYGRRITDASQFDPLFARALAAKLATYASTKVTGKMSLYQKCSAEYQQTMQMAAQADSLSEGTQGNYDSAFGSAILSRGDYYGSAGT
jgi:hypothetical protein